MKLRNRKQEQYIRQQNYENMTQSLFKLVVGVLFLSLAVTIMGGLI